MSTPADQIPVEGQNLNPGSTPQTPTVEQVQNTPQTTGPTNNFSALEAVIREQSNRIQQLLESQSQPSQPTPVPVDPEKQKVDFFNKPHDVVREIVQAELRSAIQPLQEFVQGFRAESTYDKLKNAFRNDSRFQPYWDAAVESAVDSVMLSGKVEVNTANMQSAIIQAIGLKNLGMLPGATAPSVNQPGTATPVQPNNQNMVNPPHLRPSSPPPPSNNPRQPVRQLTENERRLARENHMTDQEYLDWIEVPPQGVVTSGIGRTQS